MAHVTPAGRAAALSVAAPAAVPEAAPDVFASIFDSVRRTAQTRSKGSPRSLKAQQRTPSADGPTGKTAGADKPGAGEASASRGSQSENAKTDRAERKDRPSRVDRLREATEKKYAKSSPVPEQLPPPEDSVVESAPADAPAADQDSGADTPKVEPEQADLATQRPLDPAVAVLNGPGTPHFAGAPQLNGIPQPMRSCESAVGQPNGTPDLAVMGVNVTPLSAPTPVALTPSAQPAGEADLSVVPSALANPGSEGGKPASPQQQFQQLLQTHTTPRGAAASPVPGAASANKPVMATLNLEEPASLGELARVMRSAVGSGRANLLLRLDPPELGKVDVAVRMEHGAMTLRFEAQTEAAQAALQSHLGELKGALEQRGVHINHVEVELRPPPVPQPSAADHNAGGHNGGTAGHAFGGSQGQQWDGHGSANSSSRGSDPAAGTPFAQATEAAAAAPANMAPGAARRLDLVA